MLMRISKNTREAACCDKDGDSFETDLGIMLLKQAESYDNYSGPLLRARVWEIRLNLFQSLI